MHTTASVLLNTNVFVTALKFLKKMYVWGFKYLKVTVAFKGLFKEFISLLHNILPENTLCHNFPLVPNRYHFLYSC